MFHPEDQHGARKFVATAGLDVKQFDSGDLVGRGRMSKRGSRYLCTAVMQASEIAVFESHDPLFTRVYQRHIDRGKHHLVARQQDAPRRLQCPQEQPSLHTYPQLNGDSIFAHDWC